MKGVWKGDGKSTEEVRKKYGSSMEGIYSKSHASPVPEKKPLKKKRNGRCSTGIITPSIAIERSRVILPSTWN